MQQVQTFGQSIDELFVLGSILTEVNLGLAVAGIAIILALVQEIVVGLIVVLIEEWHSKLVSQFPTCFVVGVVLVRARTSGTYDDNLRMSLHNTFVDIFETLDKLRRNLLFVTDTQILQIERSWVASVSTHLCPLVGCGVAISPLNEVDSFSYPFVHLRHGDNVLSLSRPHIPTTIGTLTTDTTGQNGYRLHTEVLTELEILIVSQTHALVVAPCVLQTTTCLLRTDGGLPTIGVPETVATAMYYTTTRETHKLRMQVGQCLSKVRTQTVSFISIFGHQRYHVDIKVASVQHQQLQDSIFAVFCGSEHGTIFLPLLVANGDGCFIQHLRILSPALRNG